MAELEQELRALAAAVDWPEADLADRVVARLDLPAQTHHRWRAVVAIAVAAAVAVVALPTSRAAIGDWIGVRGDHIQVSPTTVITTPPTVNGEADLALGPEVAPADLRAAVGFTMPVPALPDFDHPDEVHVTRPPAGGEATLLYRARAGLPAVAGSDVGMLISAFRADLDAGLFGKVVGPGSRVEVVPVQGGTGYWIEGAPHQFFYRDATGAILPERVRLAANVLLWEVNGITVRIESTLPRDDVLRVADAMS